MSSYVLEITRQGRLPKKVLLSAEGPARQQLQKAIESGQFERVVLYIDAAGKRQVLHDTAARGSGGSPAMPRERTLSATWAIIAGLILAVVFFAARMIINP